MDGNLQIIVADTYAKLEPFRTFWEACQWHPNAEIDSYIEWCQARPEVAGPHVVVVMNGGRPSAMLVARLERRPFNLSVGYRVIYRRTPKTLSVMYAGLLGENSEATSRLFVQHLCSVVKSHEAELVFCNQLRMDSPFCRIAKRHPPFLCRDCVTPANAHWRLDLRGTYPSYDDFFSAQSGNYRRSTGKHWKKLRARFPDGIAIRRIDGQPLSSVVSTLNSIASKTYHRQLGGGFTDDAAALKTMALAKNRGWLRIYVFCVNERVVAFWTATKFKQVAYTGTTGYDPEFGTYSVGRLLLLDMIRQLLEEGDTEAIDFGFGDAGYKSAICNRHWDETSVFIFAPTVMGIQMNFAHSATGWVSRAATGLVTRFGIAEKIKTLWRRRLARKSGSEEHSE